MTTLNYEKLTSSFDSMRLVDFLFTHGLNEWQWCPRGPVTEHLMGLSKGATHVIAALASEELAGFISLVVGEQRLDFQEPNENPNGPTAEIIEYVVHPDFRGQGIGTNLIEQSKNFVFEQRTDIGELYVVHHEDNVVSHRTFIKSGFEKVITFDEPLKNRRTTLMKFKKWKSIEAT